MKAEKQAFYINFSKSTLFPVIVFLAAFVVGLIGLAIFLTLKFVEIEAQSRTIFLVVSLPIFGLVLATFFILKNSEKVLRNKVERFWEQMSPEAQKSKLNAEVRELCKTLDIGQEEISYVRATYVLTEDLALRQIEQEKKVSLKRHVKFANAEFTALFPEKNYITFVEVLLAVTPTIKQEKIDAVLSKIESARKKLEKICPDKKVKLLLATVTQLDVQDEEMKLRSSLVEKLSSTTVDVDIKFFDFETLQKIYTED